MVDMTIDDLATSIQKEFQIIQEELATKDDLKAFATKEDLKAFATKDDLKEEMLAVRRDMATKNDLALLAKRTERLEEKMDVGFHAVIAEIHDIRRVFKLTDRRMDAVEQKLGMGA